jgi:hypothetical protein
MWQQETELDQGREKESDGGQPTSLGSEEEAMSREKLRKSPAHCC